MPSSKPDLAVEEEGAKPVRWCIVMPGRQLHKEGAAGLSCPLAQSISGARAPCPGTVDLSEGARSQALLQLGSAASAPLMTTAVLQPGLLGKSWGLGVRAFIACGCAALQGPTGGGQVWRGCPLLQCLFLLLESRHGGAASILGRQK